jgi:Tat protein secretion system quality control protein TatD with DNase activity
LFHSYAGNPDFVKKIEKLPANFFYSISMPALKDESHISAISLDNLVLETDSPSQFNKDLAETLEKEYGPIKLDEKGKFINEPKYLNYCVGQVARIFGVEPAALRSIVFRNALRFLNLNR